MGLIARQRLVRHDCLGGALLHAPCAVDALLGIDDPHVRSGMTAVQRTDLRAIGVRALDAVFGHDSGHGALRVAAGDLMRTR